jgi:hypothetical protein
MTITLELIGVLILIGFAFWDLYWRDRKKR